jgi:hypothetical protein
LLFTYAEYEVLLLGYIGTDEYDGAGMPSLLGNSGEREALIDDGAYE